MTEHMNRHLKASMLRVLTTHAPLTVDITTGKTLETYDPTWLLRCQTKLCVPSPKHMPSSPISCFSYAEGYDCDLVSSSSEEFAYGHA